MGILRVASGPHSTGEIAKGIPCYEKHRESEKFAKIQGTLIAEVTGYCSVCGKKLRVSECWVFYAVPTARVIFTAKTSMDVFSLSREQVWTFSVLGD